MERYKEEFIEFMVDCQVLKFGDFVTKINQVGGHAIIVGGTRLRREPQSIREQTIEQVFGT